LGDFSHAAITNSPKLTAKTIAPEEWWQKEGPDLFQRETWLIFRGKLLVRFFREGI